MSHLTEMVIFVHSNRRGTKQTKRMGHDKKQPRSYPSAHLFRSLRTMMCSLYFMGNFFPLSGNLMRRLVVVVVIFFLSDCNFVVATVCDAGFERKRRKAYKNSYNSY